MFVIRNEQLENFKNFVNSDFVGLRYYLGDQTIDTLPMLGEPQLKVSYNGVFLDQIVFHLTTGGKTAEWAITFSEIGSTTISVPSAAQEKFESMKTTNSLGVEYTERINYITQYELDSFDGKVAKDEAMLQELLDAYVEFGRIRRSRRQ